MNQDEARRRLETTIAQRREKFLLSYLRSTENGFTLKFRQGVVDIVRTRISGAVLADDDRLHSLLDEMRRNFHRLTGTNRTTPSE
jgi:acetolactate synthase small subunit